ncbi:flagellar biosynthesis repressor FlbT [Roseomonas sp. KE0001]|uniref:flagellar biosynthesis repressor FlbT n=1 Tax=unclassified Roseomonas TaxID=2617492 RepID=UPI0018DF32C0|nr:flagellar biosynthesis repressor FlbT [Roseomonas sp. KE0001]MBI0433802.1 flagellar biosynthesis repressor FlbT [Roseomonas sp. KE0001]
MSTLVLELRQGDLLLVNGAPLRFRNRARVELCGQARFLFGKQVMPVEEAVTPARQIYYALQTAYVGREEERAAGLSLARLLISEAGASFPAGPAGLLRAALEAAERDQCYQALRLVRRVIQHEDALAEPAPEASAPPGIGAVAGVSRAAS